MRFSLAAILVCAVAAAGASRANAQAFSEADKRLYVVPYAHLDTQSRWTIQDTIQKFLPATLHENFDLLEKYPNYCVSFSGAYRYMLIKEYYPDDYARLKKYIAAGRWNVAGACLDEIDANIPSPESMIRQILYGNGFFQKEFGKASNEVLLADSNGFSWALPSVAAHCGITGFSSYKLSWNTLTKVPFALGNWIGPDGHSIVAALAPGRFFVPVRTDVSADPEWTRQVEDEGKAAGIFAGYRYLGRGYQGGAPEEDSVRRLIQAATDPSGDIHVRIAGAGQLFSDLTPEDTRKLPSYKGELLMSMHGVGGYTAHGEMKRMNRENERLADAAERAAVVANWLGAADYPADRLRQSWTRFLECQMHENVTGTSAPDAYKFAENEEVLAENAFGAVLTDSVGAICRGLKTAGEGEPLVVYNPVAVDREGAVDATLGFLAGKLPDSVRVTGPDGKPVACEISHTDEEMRALSIVFTAKVPSCGMAVYHVTPVINLKANRTGAPTPATNGSGKGEAYQFGELIATEHSLENSRYKVLIDSNGDISRIDDKALGRNLLAKPIRLISLPDIALQYPAWEIPFGVEEMSPSAVAARPTSISLVEKGPARITLQVRRTIGKSEVEQRISLCPGKAGAGVRITTTIDWKELGALLKMEFPLAAENALATYDLGIGTVQRGTNTRELFEVPAQQWVDLTNADNKFGIAVVSDSKTGWDRPDRRTLRSTLIHTPSSRSAFTDQNLLDHGCQTFTHVVYGHSGTWQSANVPSMADDYNQPLRTFRSEPHAGILGKSVSFIRVSSPAVGLSAEKLSETGGHIVVRLQDRLGIGENEVRVSFPSTVRSAQELNGSEGPIRPGLIKAGSLVTNLKPYEPKTFSVVLDPPKSELAKPHSSPLQLEMDTSIVSVLESKPEETGFLMFKPHWDPEVLLDGIRFQMGPVSGNNLARCTRQVLRFPKDRSRRRLYLLAAYLKDGGRGEFKVGNGATEFGIRNINMRTAEDRPLTGKPESILDASGTVGMLGGEVAWTSLAIRDREGNGGLGNYCCLFKYAIDVAPGVASVVFPDNPDLVVAAASIADLDNRVTTQASHLQNMYP